MSIAPNAGIVALDNFKEPTVSVDGQQGQVPKPLAGQQDYVLTASGFVPGGSIPGLGTMASQNANNVAITGGAINGTTVGVTTPAAGAFTTLSATTAIALSSGGTGKTTAPAAQANLLGYTTTASTGLATTAATGSAGTATLTFAVQGSAPYAVGSYISVQGVTPTGYNGYYQVTGCTTTTVSYANATTAAQTVAGFVLQVTALTNTSSFYQYTTGTGTAAISLPDTSTLQLGWSYRIANANSSAAYIYSSTGVQLISVTNGAAGYVTCIDTTINTAAAWKVGITEATATTGSGNMVLSSSPSISTMTLIGAMNLTGTNTSNSQFHTAQSTGTITMGGTAGTGLITFGRSTVTQTTSIQDGITSTGNTKTINFGTSGASGSTTNITIGSATSGSLGTTTIQAPTVNIGQTATQFSVINTASAVDYVQVTGATTASKVVAISAQGSDADVTLSLSPKGAGTIRFGTYTASALLAVAGYITITDSGGTSRRLLVG